MDPRLPNAGRSCSTSGRLEDPPGSNMRIDRPSKSKPRSFGGSGRNTMEGEPAQGHRNPGIWTSTNDLGFHVLPEVSDGATANRLLG